ncbi:MAG TPA: DUF2795 domain-containing protein [Gaiellaceae bacterium]|jgi:hypothetical protein|nr:DUF2795 domain-containing protein [Gaiellaceae bacterium]
MNLQRAAEIQVMLEGITLPATRAQLVHYAAAQDAEAAIELERITDRTYRSIDEVGEELAHTEPHLAAASLAPHPESGAPPGGADYVNPSPTPGAIRPDE